MAEQTSSAVKPTVVLVHGAFADASSWNGVIPRLLSAGHAAIACANPLRGRDADAAHVGSVVDSVDGPVILVGHSIGGFAATNAATGRRNVRAIVYVAAFAPEAGETAAELAGRFPGSTLGDTLAPVALPDGTADLYIAQDRYHQQFAADLPADDARVMAVTQRPIAEADLATPSGEPAWKTVPSWFLFGDADRNIPVEAHRWMAERAGARRTIEISGASHVVGMSHPDELVALIQQAAAEPAR
jgi:pimeloyl-ACP methyl ester carboxylesterase